MFTPRDWSTPQTISVAAVDDQVVEGGHEVDLLFNAAEFSGIASADTSRVLIRETTEHPSLELSYAYQTMRAASSAKIAGRDKSNAVGYILPR